MLRVTRVNHAPRRDKGRILRAGGDVLSDSSESEDEGKDVVSEDVDDSEGVRIQGVKYDVQLMQDRTDRWMLEFTLKRS